MPFKALLDSDDMEKDSEMEKERLAFNAEHGDPTAKISQEEKKISLQVDEYATSLATRYGYQAVPWFQVTQAVLGVYLVLTLFSMFFRADFFNVSPFLNK